MLVLALYRKAGRRDIPLGRAEQLNSALIPFNPYFKNSFFTT
jgi:hypothetical protein